MPEGSRVNERGGSKLWSQLNRAPQGDRRGRGRGVEEEGQGSGMRKQGRGNGG